ncbi:MAG: hypothetical protein GXO87_13165 [Chlorobi bacterium]|nr:hypothetical protein [Chlorobiota bacterium]
MKLLKELLKLFEQGLFGFALFLTLIILLKLFSCYVLKYELLFTVDMTDIHLSSVGFVLTFLIALLKRLGATPEEIQEEDI